MATSSSVPCQTGTLSKAILRERRVLEHHSPERRVEVAGTSGKAVRANARRHRPRNKAEKRERRRLMGERKLDRNEGKHRCNAERGLKQSAGRKDHSAA